MDNKKYTAKYFIKKFSAIPGINWRSGANVDLTNRSQCALGHCNSNTVPSTDEAVALNKLFIDAFAVEVWEINDCDNNVYHPEHFLLGKSPKTRVLNALTLIAAGVTVEQD